MKKIVILIAVLVLILFSYIAAGPFITIHQIKSSLEQNDSEKLSSYIDFPLLRTNMKEQFNALFMKLAAPDLKGNPLGALAMTFGSKLATESMVDSFVTPTAIANLMAGKNPRKPERGEATQGSNDWRPELFKNARYTYDSANKFSVWIKDITDDEYRIVLTRDGISWKLTNILMPSTIFGSNEVASVKAEAKEKPKTTTQQPLEPPVFEVVLRDKAFREANYTDGVQEAIAFTVAFKNLSGKDIRAFDGLLGFTDLLDNQIHEGKVAINDLVTAGAIIEWDGVLKYNKFMDTHQRLRNADFENLKIYFKTRKILFTDGSTIKFD